MALYAMTVVGLGPFGSLAAGALAGRFGARLTVAAGGVLALARPSLRLRLVLCGGDPIAALNLTSCCADRCLAAADPPPSRDTGRSQSSRRSDRIAERTDQDLRDASCTIRCRAISSARTRSTSS